MSIKETKVIVSAETSKYERGMRRMKRINKQTTQSMKSAWGGVQKALIGIAGVAGLGLVIKKSLEAADAIGKASDVIGISTDALQEYRHAARLSGVSTSLMDNSFKAFSKRVGEARNETGAMVTFLKKFDEQLLRNVQSSQSTEEALDLVMTRMGQTANQTDRAALAAAAFSRSGLVLSNMVKDGAVGLMRMRQEARDLGIVMDENLIRNSEKANDEIEKLTRILKVQFISAVAGLAPEIVKLGQHTTGWWKANQNLIKEDVAGYATKIKNVILEIKDVYDSMPEGVVSAAGYGLIGSMLFGPQAGAIIAMISLTSTKIKQFKEDHPEIFDPSYNQTFFPMPKDNIPEFPSDNISGLIGPNAVGGDITEADAKREAELEKLVAHEESKFEIAVEGWSIMDEALLERYGMLEEMESQHAQTLIGIDVEKQRKMLVFEKSAASSKIKIARGLGTALLNIAGVNAKVQFLIVKGLEIGKAIVGTHAAAAMALATPPAPNLALEAIALKAGYLNVAAIAATSLGQMAASGAGGGGNTGGGTYTSPMVMTDATAYETTKEEEKKGTLTINIQGDFIGDEGYIEMLAEKISEAVEDRDVTFIASNSKYADALA